MKKTINEFLTKIIELAIPACLSFLLFEYFDKKKYRAHSDFDYVSDNIPYIFSGLFFSILFLELIRRSKSEKDKFEVYRYIYVLVLIIAFILSIKYIGLMFEFNPRR